MNVVSSVSAKSLPIRFVIVGHIDHGKSTLLGRILYDTGVVPDEKIQEVQSSCNALGKPFEFCFLTDYLEEERNQGITIDTSQISFSVDSRDYVIIDAPGHAEFTRNMLTGAAQASAAVLVIDGKEGIREQTRRHAYLLSLVGIRQVIVAVSKMDLLGYDENRFHTLSESISSFLSQVQITPLAIIPVSATNGDNISTHSLHTPWYHGNPVLQALGLFGHPQSQEEQPSSFIVQDVYSQEGTHVVVGRVESGIFHPGDDVQILPTNIRTKIGRLVEMDRIPECAGPGKAVGMEFPGMPDIRRGMVVCHPNAPLSSVHRFRATIFWLSSQKMNLKQKMTFRCLTQESPCQVISVHSITDSSTLERKEGNIDAIQCHEIADITIQTERAVVLNILDQLSSFGRFVVASERILGIGISTGDEA